MQELDIKLTRVLEEKIFQIKSELLAIVEQELREYYDNESNNDVFSKPDQPSTVHESPSPSITSQEELNSFVLSHAKQRRIGLGNETITDWLAGRIAKSDAIDPITSDLLYNMIETVLEEEIVENISEEMIENVVQFLITMAKK